MRESRSITGVREASMRLIADFIKDWKRRRATEAAAKRQMVTSYADFIKETRPLAPQAEKHPEAALYRHAWKRAVVLEDIAVASNSADYMNKYKQFQELAGRNYYAVAPEGPYGKIRLALSGSARLALRESELARVADEQERSTNLTSRRIRGYVYLVKSGSNYKIGMTTNINRRFRELKLQLADPATREHAIATYDPWKLEEHWHERFAAKRKNGEWFGLDDEDLAEFKKHSYMNV
jgi:predicted GIY-YIG superfamily endonuclease